MIRPCSVMASIMTTRTEAVNGPAEAQAYSLIADRLYSRPGPPSCHNNNKETLNHKIKPWGRTLQGWRA